MIKKWSIENFKSYQGKTEFDFSNLTIFVGTNSAGKSTILQSILFVAQTIERHINSLPLLFNGPQVRLGTFSEILNQQAGEKVIRIGWTLEWPEKIRQKEQFLRADLGLPGIVSMKTNLAIGENTIEELAKGELISVDISVTTINADAPLATLNVKKRSPEEIAEVMKETFINVEYLQDTPLDFNFEYDPVSYAELCEFAAVNRVIGGKMGSIYPTNTIISLDFLKEIVAVHIKAISESTNSFSRRTPLNTAFIPVSPTILLSIFAVANIEFDLAGITGHAESLKKKLGNVRTEESNHFTIDDLYEWKKLNLSNDQRFGIRKFFRGDDEEKLLNDIKEKVSAELSAYNGAFVTWSVYPRISTVIRNGISKSSETFSKSLKYLGPLREEPKSLFGLTDFFGAEDVGSFGENTAAVMFVHKEKIVDYIDPLEFQRLGRASTLRKTSLKDAVNNWLKYLGVVESANATDLGKLGHGISLGVTGQLKFHDLTNVGVGVSQVLPIIIMGLISDIDATLIFEQPELHLHPAVQSRLAEFFAALSFSGRQCLVETHSEYLINRIRVLVAEEDSNISRDSINLYFIERTEGGSTPRRIEINEYGAFDAWPKDFFDQGLKDSEQLLKAALKKRKKLNGK